MGGKGGKKDKPDADYCTYIFLLNRCSFDIISTYADQWDKKNFKEHPKLYSLKIKGGKDVLLIFKLTLTREACPIRIHIFYDDYTTTIFRVNLKAYFGGGQCIVEQTSRKLEVAITRCDSVFSAIGFRITNSNEDNKEKEKLDINNIDKEIEKYNKLRDQIQSYLNKGQALDLEIHKKYLDAEILSLEGKKNEFQGHDLFQMGKYREARIKFEYGYLNYNKVMDMINNKVLSPGKVYTENKEKLSRGIIELVQKATLLSFQNY